MTAANDQELEVKFFVASLEKVEARLQQLGAKLAQARVHEVNLRLDDADGNLARRAQVLRLRRDTDNRLTYKGPGEIKDGVRLRRELEFTVGDFETALAFLEALGYQVAVMYEKYRAVYDLGEPYPVHVTLDEMPYGFFVEVEGPDPHSIRQVAVQLGFDWDRRINDSYMQLFQTARLSLGFAFRDLNFANFEGLTVPQQAMGVELADLDL